MQFQNIKPRTKDKKVFSRTNPNLIKMNKFKFLSMINKIAIKIIIKKIITVWAKTQFQTKRQHNLELIKERGMNQNITETFRVIFTFKEKIYNKSKGEITKIYLPLLLNQLNLGIIKIAIIETIKIIYKMMWLKEKEEGNMIS